jgi:hypothetical protein
MTDKMTGVGKELDFLLGTAMKDFLSTVILYNLFINTTRQLVSIGNSLTFNRVARLNKAG